ncbi:hypothetical protein T484DRAFT_1956670, partial [Baffinella frigidus]
MADRGGEKGSRKDPAAPGGTGESPLRLARQTPFASNKSLTGRVAGPVERDPASRQRPAGCGRQFPRLA